jgi:hypothetical protein
VPIRIANGDCKGEWRSLSESGERERLAATLEVLLLSDRLMLLAGLGTSLCITDESGDAVAPTMSGLWDAVQAADPNSFDHAIEKVGSGPTPDNIEILLSRCLASLQLMPDPDLEAFVADAETTIAAACDFISNLDQVPLHALLLRKLARRPVGSDRLRVFTTNYDLAFEYAASAEHLISLDGFSQSLPHLFDAAQFDWDIVRRRAADGSSVEFIAGVHYLYKLHGSIDWRRRSSGIVKVSTSPPVVAGESRHESPCLIFPRDNKCQLSYEQPFFDVLAAFQGALRGDNLGLIVAGFGFADQHIVRPLLSALKSNASLTAVFVDPRLETNPPVEFTPVRRLVESGDPRITLVAGTFADLVELIPVLQPATHLEAHAKRVGIAGIT